MLFHGRFGDCSGGGGRVGIVTHCGDEPASWRGALVSTNDEEEDMVRAEEDVEAISNADDSSQGSFFFGCSI